MDVAAGTPPPSSPDGAGHTGTELIVCVTRDACGGYWQDDVAVTCERPVDVSTGEVLTVWGICTGTRSFTCLGGWTCEVPHVLAHRIRRH